jgi:dCMP deaminase
MKKAVKKAAQHKRPSWDEYFVDMVDVIGSRATCDKSGSGCVVTHDNRIISTGYTGSVSGLPHCNDVGHDMKAGLCARTIHAEHNAMSQALKFGISLEGATMYCKIKPCPACAKMAKSLGVKRIVVKEK